MDVIEDLECSFISLRLQNGKNNPFLHRKQKPMPHPSRAYNPFMQKKNFFTNKKIPML